MQYIGSLEAAEKHISKNLQIKSEHFCKDLADLYGSSKFSATIFAEPCTKILQICTDSHCDTNAAKVEIIIKCKVYFP